MRTSTVVLLATVMALQLTAAGCAKNASERRAASPTMSERMSKESVKGRVNDIGSKYVSIRSDDGESRRVRVDDHTKMDQVVRRRSGQGLRLGRRLCLDHPTCRRLTA